MRQKSHLGVNENENKNYGVKESVDYRKHNSERAYLEKLFHFFHFNYFKS